MPLYITQEFNIILDTTYNCLWIYGHLTVCSNNGANVMEGSH